MHARPSALAAALLMLSAWPAAAVHAQTLAVPGDHATIQAAVDAATPGTTITVGAGHWLESVVVATPGLTLVGQGALIDPEYNGPGFDIRAAGVTIRSFQIANAYTGILAEPVAEPFGGLTLSDNTITSCQAEGVRLLVTSALLRGNDVVEAGQAGIEIEGLESATDIVLLSNRVDHCLEGIKIEAASCTLRKNRVTSTTSNGMEIELDATGVSEPPVARLVGNLVQHSGGEGYDGNGMVVELEGVDAVVAGNRVLDNGDTGLELEAGPGDWVRVEGNTIRGNMYGGMSLWMDGTVARNKVLENRYEGLWVGGPAGTQVTVEQNRVMGNRGEGLVLTGQGTVVAQDNRVHQNTHNGIEAKSSQMAAVLTGNRVTDNGHQGITNNSLGAVITDNTCNGNGGLLGPDLAGMGKGGGTVSSWSGNVGLGGPDVVDRL
jgi:hypothetical protein